MRINGAEIMAIQFSAEDIGRKENGLVLSFKMNEIFIFIFAFLGLMTLLALYMLVVVI